MKDTYVIHQNKTISAIHDALKDRGCQPILFVGSGLSKRYFKGPNWDQLLDYLASKCPLIDYEYGYYKQKKTLSEIGSIFAEKYREWAWSKEGRSHFPKKLFNSKNSADIYLKHIVSTYFSEITPKPSKIRKALRDEVLAIQRVQPHAIISTNYDVFLERIFTDFEPIIGQKILRANYLSIGEIFKIHGCATRPETLVLTQQDYEDWGKKKKYLSAKLLTYFAEHPLVFLGYSGTDQNIRAILSDIDEILAEQSGLITNMFFVNYNENAETMDHIPEERLIELSENRSIRIRNIEASKFKWIFDAFGSVTPIAKVKPKLLRALLARNYELVRHDIPRKAIQINYETLEGAINKEGQFANLLGISTLDHPSDFNAAYPYTLSAVAQELGFKHWSHANKLIQKIIRDKDVNIKSFDNRYHINVKTGSSDTSVAKKYSHECVQLLTKVMDNEDYDVDITTLSGPEN